MNKINSSKFLIVKNLAEILLVAGILTPLAAASQELEKSSFTVSKADIQRTTEMQSKDENINLAKITDRHPDGSLGWTFYREAEPPPYTGTFPDRRLDALHKFACTSAVFGRYTLINEQSFAGDGGYNIYTKRRFRLVDDWTASDSRSPKIVDVVMQGGQISLNQKKYRVENALSKYTKGKDYILALGLKGVIAGPTFYDEPLFLEVDGDAIYASQHWKLFESGLSLEKAKNEIKSVTETVRCV